jgi:hypothetical protein
MKIILFLILIFISLKVFSPTLNYIYIRSSEAISEFDNLIKAVVWVESQNGLYIYNPKENAVGYFQIRQCRVDDYNKRTGKHYKLNDFYNYELSKEMFMYFAKGKTLEKAARDWNGSGKQTIEYWNKVKTKFANSNY